MIIIIKIITGEEYIGYVEDNETPIHEMEYVTLNDPMAVIDQKDETGYSCMRLNDAILLAEDDFLTFKQKHVITYYKPAEKLRQYYEKASVYAKNYAKPRLHKQIISATKEIENVMREEESFDPWVEFIKNFKGSTKH